MKFIKPSLICCILSITLYSCAKKDLEPNNTMSYTVDGTTRTVIPGASLYDSDNSLLISGGPNGDDEISIFFDGGVQAGTYDLTGGNAGVIAEYKPNGSCPCYISQSGTVNIISMDGKTINGRFEFTGAYNNLTKSVSGGKFTAVIKRTDDRLPPDDSLFNFQNTSTRPSASKQLKHR